MEEKDVFKTDQKDDSVKVTKIEEETPNLTTIGKFITTICTILGLIGGYYFAYFTIGAERSLVILVLIQNLLGNTIYYIICIIVGGLLGMGIGMAISPKIKDDAKKV